MNLESSFQKLQNPPHYQFEFVSCYLCGSSQAEVFLVGEEDLTGKEGEFQYVTCKDCGFAYQNPRIDSSQIKDFYDSEYIAHRKKKDWGPLTPLYERAMNKHDRDKVKLVSKFIKLHKDSRVLDVGCAVGSFLLFLKKKYDCSISGVDFKADFDFPGFAEIDFHSGFFYDQDALVDSSFDLITMWHFLEHCYDPEKSLVQANKLVSKKGRVVIEVPRLDSVSFKLFSQKWPGIQAPQHTAMYSKEHLIKMVEKSGLRIVKYLPYGAFPSYFYLFTGSYFKMFGKGLDLDKVVGPYFLGQCLLSPLLMFEKRLNIAMQTVVCEKGE